MDPTPPHSAESIVAVVRDLPADEHEAYIAAACEGDKSLIDQVRELLAKTQDVPTDLLDATVAADGSRKTSGKKPCPNISGDTDSDLDIGDDDPLALLRAFKQSKSNASLPVSQTEKEGDQVGPYKLLQQIGEGGFGTVWMAEQSEPISRKVALKVIKAGMDTKEVLARFEAERQALAMMDHPNIAKVLDAGATRTGRPFFAMELVKGIAITTFCDKQGLTTSERLALFGDVCSAISHAHQKGIIHRDIKPNNVMVTLHGDKPVVKVIDFGIAKATQSRLTDKTLFTRFEQMIGTPVYMSPEQAGMSGLDIDTRSDIYALGVLLYEMIAGKPPFDGKSLLSAGFEEMRRIIREDEPPKPSSRISTLAGEDRTNLAKARQIDPEKLDRMIEPDLDWIVMKAIEKDRSRRYETANAFAQDIVRFLTDEPVSATPPSAGYKFRKFAKRNRVALRVAAGIAAVLVVATIVSVWQAIRATKAEEFANQEAQRATAAQVLANEEAARATVAERSAREEAARATVAEKSAKDEAARAMAAEKLAKAEATRATTAEKLARDEAVRASEAEKKATAQAERALAAEKQAAATAEAERAARMESEAINNFLIGVFKSPDPFQSGRSVTVAETLDNAVRMLDSSFGVAPERLARLRTTIGETYDALGLYEEAISLQEKVLSFLLEKHGEENAETLDLMGDLASAYDDAGRREDALKLGEEVAKISRKVFGERSKEAFSALSRLATYYLAAGRRQEAMTMQEEVLKGFTELLGPEDPRTWSAKSGLANYYDGFGRTEQALIMREEVYKYRLRTYGEKDLRTSAAMAHLAFSYNKAGREKEALPMYEAVLKVNMNIHGENHPSTLGAMTNLAGAYENAERLDEAIELQERSLAIKRRVLPSNHPYLFVALGNLARFYAAVERWDESIALGEESYQLSLKENGKQHPETLDAMGQLASLYTKAGHAAKAQKMLKEELQLRRGAASGTPSETLMALNNLIAAEMKAGRWEEVAKMSDEYLNKVIALHGPDHGATFEAMCRLANAHQMAGQVEEAALTAGHHIERLRQAGHGPESPALEQANEILVGYARKYDLEAIDGSTIAGYYAAHQDEFRQASVHLQMISFKLEQPGEGRGEQRKQAEALREKIGTGTPFAELAKKHSQDSWADVGGDIGRVERGTYGWELERAIFSLEAGIPEIHDNHSMLWILLVKDREEKNAVLPLAEVAEEIEGIFHARKREELMQRWRSEGRERFADEARQAELSRKASEKPK
jgi:serine/threonine protein kinase